MWVEVEVTAVRRVLVDAASDLNSPAKGDILGIVVDDFVRCNARRDLKTSVQNHNVIDGDTVMKHSKRQPIEEI